MTTPDEELERLKQRLERERKARRQAEVIAERGMRELWVANSELRDKVTARTAELELLVRSMDHRARAMASIVSRVCSVLGGQVGPNEQARWLDVLAAVSATGSVAGGVVPGRTDVDPAQLGDQLLARWQRTAAKHGQLLTVEASPAAAVVRVDWARVQAVADVLVEFIVARGDPGAVSLAIEVVSGDVAVSMTAAGPFGTVGGGFGGDLPALLGAGAGGTELVVLTQLALDGGGSVSVETGEGATTVRVNIPPANPSSPNG